MGKLLSKLFGKREIRILMLGLDAAGKTSEFQFQCGFGNGFVLRAVHLKQRLSIDRARPLDHLYYWSRFYEICKNL